MMDALQRAPLTWDCRAARRYPFCRNGNAGMATSTHFFYKGHTTSDSRRRPTKLTGYFLLDRAGLVEKTEQLIMAFLTWLICDVPNMIIYSPLNEIDCKNIPAQLGLDHL
jgi:hypothetical protein